MIPYGRQDIDDADIRAVEEVLRSDWLTQGPAVERFERVVAEYCGAPYALAVSNATAALHLACRAIGLGPGDRLWTSPNTFVASANCARFCGADVDFVDIDSTSGNMSVAALERKLAGAQRAGTLPKVVVPVHFAGEPCDMKPIRALAERYGFFVIEDASHAIGGRHEGEPIGACVHADIVVFSFHPVKIITSGEGGMALTRDQKLYERLVLLRSHGVTRDVGRMENAEQGVWYYEQVDLGYNYRMTDIQAALGASQMRRLDTFVARRHLLAQRYDAELAGLPLVLPTRNPLNHSALHLYVIRLRLQDIRRTRREVFDFMRSSGIGVNVHYIPVHLQPYYRKLGFNVGDFPNAEEHYRRALTLPLYAGLSAEAQNKVVASLRHSLEDRS